jgi:EmrB/QacA subfamily drug resistance transporter
MTSMQARRPRVTAGRPTRDPEADLRPAALALICLAQLMAALDVTIVNLSLPSLQQAMDLSNAGLAWVVDAYTLTYGGLLLLGGRAGDLLGHRRTLVLGASVFVVASAAAGLAHDPATLLAARAGQGLGAAFATPTGLALITTLVPAGQRRSRALVVFGAMGGLGITLGLVLGGVLTEYASWRWVFLVNLPLGALLVAAGPRVLPSTRGPRRRLDVAGAGVGTAGLLALVYGVIRAGTAGWGDEASTTALAAAAVLGAVLVLVERAAPEPMLPPALLAHRVRLGACVVAGLLFAALYPSFFLLSRTLQQVQSREPVDAAVRFLPVGVGVLVFALVARRLLASTGARPLVLAGTAATVLGCAGLVSLSTDTPYPTLLVCLVGLGAGVGTTFVATSALSMTDVPDGHTGVASGLLSTCQAVGGTVGVAIVAAVASSRTNDRLATLDRPATPDVVREALLSGFGVGFLVAALLAGTALLVAAVTVRRSPPG